VAHQRTRRTGRTERFWTIKLWKLGWTKVALHIVQLVYAGSTRVDNGLSERSRRSINAWRLVEETSTPRLREVLAKVCVSRGTDELQWRVV